MRNTDGKSFNVQLQGNQTGTLVVHLRFCKFGAIPNFDSASTVQGTTTIQMWNREGSLMLPYQSDSLALSVVSRDGSCVSMHGRVANLRGAVSFGSLRVLFSPPVLANCALGLYPVRRSTLSSSGYDCVPQEQDTETHPYAPVMPLVDSIAVFAPVVGGNSNDTTLTVADNIPPVIAGCPANQIVNVTTFSPTVAVTWIVPNAADNIGLQSLTPLELNTPGLAFVYRVPIQNRLTRYTYIATDTSGLSTNCRYFLAICE